MSNTFYSDWSIEVIMKQASYSQRFKITGSDAADGYYAGVPGFILPVVSGTEWTIDLEWNDNRGSGWLASDVRNHMTFDPVDGLVVTLSADDNTLNIRRDYDYTDLVLYCRSVDPALNPPQRHYPYEFTYHKKGIDPDNPDKDPDEKNKGFNPGKKLPQLPDKLWPYQFAKPPS